jgi:hypothetical protein
MAAERPHVAFVGGATLASFFAHAYKLTLIRNGLLEASLKAHCLDGTGEAATGV